MATETGISETYSLAIRWPLLLTYPIERWSEGELEILLDTISDSESLRAACRKLGIHHSYVYRRASSDREFNAKLRAARDAALEVVEEQALSIMDNCDDDLVSISKARARMEGRLRLIGIARRSQNLTQVNIMNDNRTLVTNDPERAELIAKLEESRTKALENNNNTTKKE